MRGKWHRRPFKWTKNLACFDDFLFFRWHFQMRQVGDGKRVRSWSQRVHLMIEMKNINMMMLHCDVMIFRIYVRRWNCILFVTILLVSILNIFVHNIHVHLLYSFLLHFYLGSSLRGWSNQPLLGGLFQASNVFCSSWWGLRCCHIGYPSKWFIELQHERHDIPY